MTNGNKTAAQRAAEKSKSREESSNGEASKQEASQAMPAQAEATVGLVEETENRALREENQRLAAELQALKEKTQATNRSPSVFEPGSEIPEFHGVFRVNLSAPPKDGRPAHVMFAGDLVALDEPDALRQGIAALCDKHGWQSPPHWLVRKVEPVGNTEQERNDRIRFRKWRSANQKREDRGESLLPLPSNLSQFRDHLTDTEELATGGKLEPAH